MEANSIQQVGLENKPSIKRKRKKGYKQPWVLHFMVLPWQLWFLFFLISPCQEYSWHFRIISLH